MRLSQGCSSPFKADICSVPEKKEIIPLFLWLSMFRALSFPGIIINYVLTIAVPVTNDRYLYCEPSESMMLTINVWALHPMKGQSPPGEIQQMEDRHPLWTILISCLDSMLIESCFLFYDVRCFCERKHVLSLIKTHTDWMHDLYLVFMSKYFLTLHIHYILRGLHKLLEENNKLWRLLHLKTPNLHNKLCSN